MCACVVQRQDGADTPAQMGVRIPPARSTSSEVKSLTVRAVSPSVIRHIIVERHYLHAMPAACWRCFGIYVGDELKGAAAFTAGPRNGFRVLHGAAPQHVAVLARLWLADDLPKNSESRVIGILLRHAKRERLWKLILSYADPAAGHAGIIYRATGWLYLGRGQPSRYLDLGGGELVHPRTAYGRFGVNNAAHLSRTGIAAKVVTQGGKHRYAYVLDPAWRWRLRDPVRPYPGKDGAP